MPELPEVETTVRALNRAVRSLRILNVWSSYNSSFHDGKNNIKNIKYFARFKKAVVGKRILGAERRAKNIIINLSGGASVLVHMKMTGHFLYGTYKKISNFQKPTSKQTQDPKSKIQNGEWEPKDKTGPLGDPMNRFIRMVWILSSGKTLAFSDLRRFAKIHFLPTAKIKDDEFIKTLGPEPLAKNFSEKIFRGRLLSRPSGKIKQVLMDQSVIAGIGNIYSDEILWRSGVHPLSVVKKISPAKITAMYKAMKAILRKAIRLGGDSASDFRLLDGRPAGFQNFHKAYRQTGKPCQKRGCRGKITRVKLGGRSAHFCGFHQKKYQ
ncbi:bifunctional DNA-formamidopyrimidine glycosylase/DNA-(apurinic or apyrimidinic site) lyase [Patescibacteria group bacterium]|nr:bifunctional DNA-formamidopyrimidine glycosylase/DNA-(apurinic or apyrimidinic site) lyase [Patescibacteria group bacterium]